MNADKDGKRGAFNRQQESQSLFSFPPPHPPPSSSSVPAPPSSPPAAIRTLPLPISHPRGIPPDWADAPTTPHPAPPRPGCGDYQGDARASHARERAPTTQKPPRHLRPRHPRGGGSFPHPEVAPPPPQRDLPMQGAVLLEWDESQIWTVVRVIDRKRLKRRRSQPQQRDFWSRRVAIVCAVALAVAPARAGVWPRGFRPADRPPPPPTESGGGPRFSPPPHHPSPTPSYIRTIYNM